MSNVKKILVIGAGVAGPAVCFWLKRFGFFPILIEKAPAMRKGGHGLDVRGVAIDLVQKMGIYEALCSRRTQVELGQYVDSQGNLLHEERGERFSFREGDDVEIARGDLIEILIDALEDVPCRFNQSVQSIQQTEEDVEVRFQDGKIEHFDLVIGADGLHSRTRRLVFDADEYQLIHLGACFSVFSIPNYLKLHHAEVQFEANQKLISITSDRDPVTAQVAFMFRSPNVMSELRDENAQKQFIRTTFQDFGWETNKVLDLMSDSKDFYFDSVTQVKMPLWTKGRVALLGDAGYSASPISGQGNNLALVGAYILAGELKQADGDFQRAFKGYNEKLHPFVEANQNLGLLVNESFLVQDEVSQEIAEERSHRMMAAVQLAANGITLPRYS